tara:strand:+ start:146 stop:1540 length:1395 start_codon:yes stop_codon:yes gene_type:complete
MAQARQLAFLKKLHSEIAGKSADYRAETADLRVHTFKLNHAQLLAVTMLEFSKRSIKPTPEQHKEISDAALTAYLEILAEIKILTTELNVNVLRKATYLRKEGLRLVFQTTGSRMGTNGVEAKKWPSQNDPAVTFDRIKLSYEAALSKFFKKLQTITDNAIRKPKAGKSGKLNKETRVGQFFHLGHLDTMGVAESRFRDGLAKAFQSLNTTEHANMTALLGKSGIDLSFQRVDKENVMHVQIESKKDNLDRGTESKEAFKRIREALIVAIDKFDLVNMSGSDSPKQRKQKQVTKALTEPFRAIASKSLKVKVKKPAPVKDSSSKKTVLKKRSSGSQSKAGIGKATIKVGATKRRKKTPSPASSPLHLMVAINKKLPQVVAQNMQSPALQYQTGRFAASVRVTDVVTTPKGYPSVGYTYDKFPYQTFEEGGAQGDPQRDPRKLINQSIREIAAELAIGRFFTRRV